MAKIEYKRTILILRDGEKQDIYFDPKFKGLAEVRRDKKIYVSKKFFNLKKNQKVGIIYHERGHSNFCLWKTIMNICPFFLSIGLTLMFFSLLSLILNYLLNFRIFNISNVIWIILLVCALMNLFSYVMFMWFLEILADANSTKKVNKVTMIHTIGNFYKKKKLNPFGDWVLHPPWKLRKKIIEELD